MRGGAGATPWSPRPGRPTSSRTAPTRLLLQLPPCELLKTLWQRQESMLLKLQRKLQLLCVQLKAPWLPLLLVRLQLTTSLQACESH